MPPTAHFVVTGYEVLLGDTTDTNGPFLAKALDAEGFVIDGITTLGDDRPRIIETLRRLAGTVDVVVFTGGLGPTEDDHTRDAFSEAFDRPCSEDPELLADLTARLAKRGLELGPANRLQVRIPRGADKLLNSLGTAPGFALEERGTWFYTAPGVPREMTQMWQDVIHPHIRARHQTTPAPRCSFWTFGKRESELVGMLVSFREKHPDVELGYRATLNGIQIKARPFTKAPLTAETFAPVKEDLRAALGVYSLGEEEVRLEKAVLTLLRERRMTLAVAESFTGGLVAHHLTNIPGSSDILKAGIVAYSETMKTEVLGVSAETIAAHTVYSEECAREMALGVRKLAGVDIALATTGIAGPPCGDEPLMVGSCFFGLALPDGTAISRANIFPGPREFVKRLGANAALYFLYRWLQG